MDKCNVVELGIRHDHALDHSFWQQGYGYSLCLHPLRLDEERTVHFFLSGLIRHQCHDLRGSQIWNKKGQALCDP